MEISDLLYKNGLYMIVFVLDTVFVVPYDATIILLALQRIHKDLRVANEFETHWRILSR